MPLLIANIETENPDVTEEEKVKLLDFVYEEDKDESLIVDDIRTDDFGDVLDNIKKIEDEKKKREQDGTTKSEPPQTQTTSSAQPEAELKKEDAKEKSLNSPESAPATVDNSGAQTQEVVKDLKINSSPVGTGVRVTSYIEQGKVNDNSYWAYRAVVGPTTKDGKKENEKNTAIQSIKGFVKYKFGADWNTLTKGISIKSVWDVIIAMNVPQVGIFNDKVPYVAEENTEQHMMILNNSMVYDRGTGTSIGIFQQNPSWADEPYWCGAWTDFLTNRAGLSRSGGNTVNVDVYHRNLAGKGLVNAPATIKNNKDGKIAFQNSWLPNNPENYNSNGVGAIFVKGYHFKEKGELLPAGQKLLNFLLGLDWGMATVSVGTSTHVETCVYLSNSGNMITIGGNTSGANDRNGTQIAVKAQSISKFCGKKDYVVFGKITGDVNRSTNRLNAKYNITPTISTYLDSVNKNKKNINTSLSTILKQIT
jgi:hypothetical protein